MKKFEKSVKLRIAIAVMAAVLIALVVIVVCLGTKEKPVEDQAGNPSENVVATPYCQLKYPAQWGEQLTVETSVSDERASYAFCAQIEGKRYELYAVHFGSSAPGNLLGYLPHNGSVIPVYIDCYSIPNRSELSESELSQILAMMEGVNEVAQSITAVTGFAEQQ